jgi:hypothetical protein
LGLGNRGSSGTKGVTRVVKDIVLDAEMVAYSDRQDRIDGAFGLTPRWTRLISGGQNFGGYAV